METVLYVIGATWIVMGTFVVLYTERARKWWVAITDPIPFKALAFCPILVGVLLMIAAPTTHTFWLVEAVGALAVIKGLLLLLIPKEEHRRWLMSWWRERSSDVTWRFWGLLGVILGVFLVLRL
ncbi:MAG: hypothetical protein WHX93_09470 [bacterium]